MSRIDEAWARVSGATAHRLDDMPRVPAFDPPPPVTLQDYPAEAETEPTTLAWSVEPSVAATSPVSTPVAAAVEPPAAAATTIPAPAPAAAPAPTTVSAPAPVPAPAIVPAPAAVRTSSAVVRHALGAPDADIARKLVVDAQTAPIAVEQYRRLAGALHDVQVEHGLKTLMVTSAVPGEGKTLTIANLALTLSEACQRRVVLIDADLRRPTLHQIFRLPNTHGLSDVLRSDGAEAPLLQITDHLTVLPAGRLESPMAMTSDRMGALLDTLSASFDWVLIDAAPVGFMPEARMLARLTKAVLFVIAARSTPHTLVTRAVAEIGVESIVGTVLNSVSDEDVPAAAYYQDYYAPGAPAR